MIIKIDVSLIKNKKTENSLNVKDNKFEQLMQIYLKGMKKVEEYVNSINDDYKDIYDRNLINHVTSRIKSPESIIKKMKKKNYELNYKNLIENVNDIAGVRIVCPFKSNVFEVVDIIREFEDCKILNEKDYITNPKKSGYSSYHIIVEVPVVMNKTIVYTKVEIQVRTMAMDFWAVLEHEIKYKSRNEITSKMSRELVMYAKIIDKLDNKMLKIHNKKFKRKIELTKKR